MLAVYRMIHATHSMMHSLLLRRPIFASTGCMKYITLVISFAIGAFISSGLNGYHRMKSQKVQVIPIPFSPFQRSPSLGLEPQYLPNLRRLRVRRSQAHIRNIFINKIFRFQVRLKSKPSTYLEFNIYPSVQRAQYLVQKLADTYRTSGSKEFLKWTVKWDMKLLQSFYFKPIRVSRRSKLIQPTHTLGTICHIYNLPPSPVVQSDIT